MTDPITTDGLRTMAESIEFRVSYGFSLTVEQIKEAGAALRVAANQLDAANSVILAVMREIPAGYTPAHTPENLPDRVRDLVVRYAQTDRLEAERDAANAELAAFREQVADLNAEMGTSELEWKEANWRARKEIDALREQVAILRTQCQTVACGITPPVPDQRPATEQKP